MIKSDTWIKNKCVHPARLNEAAFGGASEYEMHTCPNEGMSIVPMITPFQPISVRENDSGKITSYGTSSYGYDIRAAGEWRVAQPSRTNILDPKQCNEKCFSDEKSNTLDIPPGGFVLARTVEYFRIPRDVLVVCLGKSTYARLGLIVNVTPLEPEWEGHLVLEFSNTTPLPIRIYANEGIAQLLFLGADGECEVSYADRGGKYQHQQGIVLPKL